MKVKVEFRRILRDIAIIDVGPDEDPVAKAREHFPDLTEEGWEWECTRPVQP